MKAAKYSSPRNGIRLVRTLRTADNFGIQIHSPGAPETRRSDRGTIAYQRGGPPRRGPSKAGPALAGPEKAQASAVMLGRLRRCERQVLIVIAEVGEGRYGFEADALDLAVGVEVESHMGGLDGFVGELGNEAVVLPVFECAGHPGCGFEIDSQLAVHHRDLDVAVPGVGVGACVTLQRQRWTHRGRLRGLLGEFAQGFGDLALRLRPVDGGPVRFRQAQVVIQELVHQAQDDFTVLAVDLDGESHVFVRYQHHGCEKPEYRTSVPHDLRAPVILDFPTEGVLAELWLRRLECSRLWRYRLRDERRPHLTVRAPRKTSGPNVLATLHREVESTASAPCHSR